MVFSLFFVYDEKFTLFRALSNDKGVSRSAEATWGSAPRPCEPLKRLDPNFYPVGRVHVVKVEKILMVFIDFTFSL